LAKLLFLNIQNKIFTAEAARARRINVIFRGSKIPVRAYEPEEISPNKNLSLQSNQRILGLWEPGNASVLFPQG
jgi:hypothetical protein